MWATPFPNPSWTSLQQSNFQNVPHDQVDWASLAKQWIAQREVVGFTPDPSVNPPPPPLENVVPPPPPPPPQDGDQNEMEISDEENGTHRTHGFHGPPPGVNNSGGWGWNERPPWEAPPPNWGMQPPLGDGVRAPNFDFNQGAIPFQDTYDYNHGSEPPFGYDQPPEPPPADFNSHYWSPHPPHHDGGLPVTRHPRHQRSRYHSPPLTETEDSGLDAQKRKQLPAWIREGLEKMERAKQKKEEKERLESEEARLKQEKAEKEMMRDKSGDGPAIPRRSRFDSDDEDETVKQVRSRSASPSKTQTEEKKKSPSPEPEKTEEEKQLEMMTKVRKWMMEILLEVTSQEIEVVAKDVYYKARNQAAKAPARQLAKSSALASLSTLGLGYESDSEHSGSDTDNDSDAELQESIRRKKEAFEKEHSKIFSDDEEYDAEAEAEKQTPEFLKNPISERHSNPFHNKYDSIPGLDVPNTNDSKKDHVEKSKNSVSSKSRTKKSGTESDSGSSSVDSSSSSSDSESSSTSSTSNELGSGESDSQSEGQKDLAYSKIRTQSYQDERVPKVYRNSDNTDRHIKREKQRKSQRGNDHMERAKNRESHRVEKDVYKDDSDGYKKESVCRDDRVEYEKKGGRPRHGDSYGEDESNSSDWREQEYYREENRHRSRSRSRNRSGKRARSKEHRAKDKYKSRETRVKYEEYKHKKRDSSRDKYADYDQEKSRRESDASYSSSKLKSHKKRKHSLSPSVDDEYDRRSRSSRDFGSSKHSYRDKYYDDEYSRGGKKSSRKHKSRSRSRSSGGRI